MERIEEPCYSEEELQAARQSLPACNVHDASDCLKIENIQQLKDICNSQRPTMPINLSALRYGVYIKGEEKFGTVKITDSLSKHGWNPVRFLI